MRKLRLEFASNFTEDIRTGARGIWNAPGFACIVVLTLALGIGADTAIFSVVYQVLLRPPAYPHGERMVEVLEATAGQKLPVSWINLQHWRNENHTFEEMAGFETADLTLSGRVLSDADDRAGAMPVAVVSAEFGEARWAAGLK